jgi:ATP-dependent protease ClpP protease subunit
VGWDITAESVSEQIDNATGDLVFDMNSPGGFITEGVAILNKIRSYSDGKTTARISFAASMMTQIALACDDVQCYDNAVFMVHNAQGGEFGDHRAMDKKSVLLKSMTNMLSRAYINKTGKSEDEIKKLMDDETFLFGEEIVDNGFADSVISTDEDTDKNYATALAQETYKNCVNKTSGEEPVQDQIAAIAGLGINGNAVLDGANGGESDNLGYNSVDAGANGVRVLDQEAAVGGEQTRGKPMDINQLKTEHPALFAEAVSIGTNAERERVEAHVTMGEASGDTALAMECIKNGAELSASINAKYMAAGMKNNAIVARTEESEGDLNTPAADADAKETALAKATAEALGVEIDG